MTERRIAVTDRRKSAPDLRQGMPDRRMATSDLRDELTAASAGPPRDVWRTVALRLVQALPWVIAVAVGIQSAVFPDVTWARPALIAAFFAATVLRTVVAAFLLPTGKGLPLTMAAGLALFGIGSLVLALNPGLGFPSPAEAIFGAAYLCFTGFLILDTSARGVWSLRAILETGVIAGGIISGALFALLIPLSGLETGGLPLLVALIYPIADVALITILLTQLITGRKPRDQRSALLVGGLLALAAVDISLPLGLGGGGYAFTTLEDVVWAVALATLAAGASRPSRAAAAGSRVGIGPAVAVASALCALVVLAVNSGPALTWLIRLPAVVTMLLSLGLLLSSLRDAHLANEAQRLSRTDDLTGLGNRRAVMELLAGSEDRPLALLLIDLNGFKAVNDTFGHPEGDRLLAQVGRRLADVIPDADLVARLGGDEFAIICADAAAESVVRQAETLLVAMDAPLPIADLGLTVSIAIGIASSYPERVDGTELMRRADVALYVAKGGVTGYEWYDARADNFSRERLHLIEELRAAISHGQLRAFFQPQIRVADGTLDAVEALVRWQHPKRGMLVPAEFLPMARAAGLMLPLSLEMIRISIAQAAAWAAAGEPLRLSLNVDPPELLSGAWVPALIAEIERHKLDPALIIVELTEELLVSDPARAAERIHELARHGIDVSIDDYGTGYSGLTWLQTLPVTELKLARPFVSLILSDERTRHIVESTVALANRLGLRVVAEGVEDEATAAAITSMGADLIQGYLISRPLMAGTLDTWRKARLSPVD
jgi:diguanylate cyclase (GGDEF)-like protein